MENGKKSSVSIQSVARAIEILQCFKEHDELGLTEISNLVGLHKSTTAGLVNTLREEKFLEMNEASGKLRLGIELFCLSQSAKYELRDICRPYIDELLKCSGETVNLAVRDENQVVYIEKKESAHSMRICTAIGEHKPFYCTAIGKAIFAQLSDEEVTRAFASTEIQPFTSHTITDLDRLREELAQVRQTGIALDNEELEYGLICIAAPVFNPRGHVEASISVSGPAPRMDSETRERLGEMVKSVAAQISAKL